MKTEQRYTHDAMSAHTRARVSMLGTPTTWFFATKINGQRPKAPPS